MGIDFDPVSMDGPSTSVGDPGDPSGGGKLFQNFFLDEVGLV